ncbi:MAG: sulfite exporter TauE/SafE family protein [Actinobacteria bacterium]|nr:sulfite exporter TauE/SafE family protein [Actinomycetota bacterium]
MGGDLAFVALAGFCASLVDGALGMGFGPTSSSILLGVGLPPASVSTTVNLAKVATGIASSISHWRFRNIDHRLVLQLAVPGALGALLGVTVLSNVDAATLRPVLAVLLLVIGLRILLRYSRPIAVKAEEFTDLDHDPDKMPPFDDRGVEVVAAAGGLTNGMIGAWGPVVTPFLMHRELPPRFAVGSVNTAEVAVAMVSATSLIAALGSGGLDVGIVIAMLAGGVVAAPVAAWFVRKVPPRPMGVAVAALLLLTNARELSSWAELGAARWWVYALLVALVTAAALRPRVQRAQGGAVAATA